MKRLVIKVGTQAPGGLQDGMLVCTLDPADPVSLHMQTVYALVDVPDTWASRITSSLQSVGAPGTSSYRARGGYIPLCDLAWALGNPDLEFQWRSPFIVAPRSGVGLFPSLLRSTVGVNIPHRTDFNLVSEGTFTVGTGGDYATWGTAAADVAPIQTNDLLLYQITALSETVSVSFTHDTGGFLFLLSSCEPPWGAPDAGFITSLTTSSAKFSVTTLGTGTVDIGGLYLRLTTFLTGGAPMLLVDPIGTATAQVHDNLFDGQTFAADGLAVGGISSGLIEAWNNQVWEVDGRGYVFTAPPTTIVSENNTAYLCIGGGFVFSDVAGVTVQNCAAFDSAPAADFVPGPAPITATTNNNASSDATAPGGASLTFLVAAVDYVSLVDTLITFLKVSPASTMIGVGAVALISGNVAGSRGNALLPTPTIGCDEFVATLYVTLGNCMLPRPTVEAVGGLPGPTYQGVAVGVPAVTVTMPASFPVSIGIPNVITATANLLAGTGFQGSYSLTGAVDVTAHVLGSFDDLPIVLDTLPEGRRRLGLTPKGALAGEAYTLPSTPLLVHLVDALVPQDVEDANTPLNGHFLVSVSFSSSGPGDPFGDHGAKAGSIGSRRQINPIIYTFRDAFPYEVVWFIAIDSQGLREDRGLYRYEPDDQGVFGWKSYVSLPERALAGTRAFDQLDPDKIYDYYARLVGAVYFEWQRDSKSLLDFIDPLKCPERLLNFLGEQFGLRFDASDSEAIKRERIATAIPVFKKKGLDASYLLQLRALNYQADVREVWVNPTHVDNWTDEASAPAAIQAHIAALGLTGAIDPNSGQKGQDFIMPPHGYFVQESDSIFGTYYPSSRVAVFLNDRSDNPLPATISGADLAAIRNRVVAELRDATMPLHVDVRFFGTRFPLTDAQDTLEVTDTMTFSNPTNYPFHSEVVVQSQVTGNLVVSA